MSHRAVCGLMEGDRRRKAIISGSEQPTNELKLPVGTQLASQDFWSLICSQRPAATHVPLPQFSAETWTGPLLCGSFTDLRGARCVVPRDRVWGQAQASACLAVAASPLYFTVLYCRAVASVTSGQLATGESDAVPRCDALRHYD